MQRGVAITVARVHVRALVEHEPNHGFMSSRKGNKERVTAVGRGDVRIGAGGDEGLIIIDIERPTAPQLIQRFNPDGQLGDAQDVVVASTNASLYAYVAAGRHGLQVVQLTAPDTQPGFYGFSPQPQPQRIAHYPTSSRALAISKGLDRDRAVDEHGNQIAVFGRLGSRPFNAAEMRKLYLDRDGQPWTVQD